MKHLVVLALLLTACAENREPDPAPVRNPYTGTRWIMENGDYDAPTIDFADSRATGSTGCNRWFAQTIGADGSLTFTAIGTTRRACEPELMAVERAFVATLRGTRSARLADGILILQDETGAELARFERTN